MTMRIRIGLAAAGLIALASYGAIAAPLTQVAPAGGALEMPSLVEQVHRCHDVPQDGYGGWHYHVGRHCRRVDVPPPGRRYHYREHYRRPICRRECNYVGPIKVCKDRCY